MKLKPIPTAGLVGEHALREAAASEFGQVARLVRNAVRQADPSVYDIQAIYPDRVVYGKDDGRSYAYPYTLGDDNSVALGTATEVVAQHVPVSAAADPIREAAPNNPTAATKGGAGTKSNNASALEGDVFIEAVADADAAKPVRYLVRVIRAGTSLNNITYPPAVLREAAPKFEGVRVFVKSDAEHIKGGGKDFRQLVGRLSDAKFIEAGGGEIQATLDVLDSSDVAAKLREAVQRGMTDLFGLSIDASGSSKKSGQFREATSIKKVDSVDLIIEPGAGGQFIRFAEAAANPNEENTMLRQQMIDTIRSRDAKRAESLADASDADVLAAFREAVAAEGSAGGGSGESLTRADLEAHTRLIEARAEARVAIAKSKLPQALQDVLHVRFREASSVTTEDVTAAIEEQRKLYGRLVEGAQVSGLGDVSIEMGEDRADKVKAMLDDFFDPSKKRMSFREAYVEITGDRQVTGLLADCDQRRLREAVGDQRFAEAVSSGTFSSILGDSITRAMVREYGAGTAYQDWRWLCDVVPVNDFRQQQRPRMGGYGNLPGVAENGPYTPLTSPSDEKATYAPTKRGGTETISIEAIANDDVGAIRRIPLKLATAAGRTLYEFVYSFLDANGLVYDGKALFHADHANLGTAALSDAAYNAARLAIRQQLELSSNKRLGLSLRHLAVPAELEEVAYDMFRRDTNLDASFTQTSKPTVHVVDHWTDADNWFATADASQVPLVELGFYGGREDPELFVQDLPTQGSLFSNDQIKYKIRHIYGAAVLDYRGFYGALVA